MKAFQRNPVFWLMWAIPGFAVLAGFLMVAIALQDADRALPSIYHWEGESLDADFERAKLAARLGLEAELTIENGQCSLTIKPAPISSGRLQLRLTNGRDARLDRTTSLVPGAQPGQYAMACEPLQRGRWRVAIQDAANTWYLRGLLDDAQKRVSLVARNPAGEDS